MGADETVQIVQRCYILLICLIKHEPLLTSEEGAVLEHGDGLGVEHPVAALAWLGGMPGHLDEAVIEAEDMPE